MERSVQWEGKGREKNGKIRRKTIKIEANKKKVKKIK